MNNKSHTQIRLLLTIVEVPPHKIRHAILSLKKQIEIPPFCSFLFALFFVQGDV